MKDLLVNIFTVALTLTTTLGLSKPAVLAQSPTSIAGVWQSSEGDITFGQSGANVLGNYTQDDGVIEGTLYDNVLTGYWIENISNRRCNTFRNGSYYWGRIRFVFNGSAFSGLWSYCNDEPTSAWTGYRKSS
jgi:hypothetical protein